MVQLSLSLRTIGQTAV